MEVSAVVTLVAVVVVEDDVEGSVALVMEIVSIVLELGVVDAVVLNADS